MEKIELEVVKYTKNNWINLKTHETMWGIDITVLKGKRKKEITLHLRETESGFWPSRYARNKRLKELRAELPLIFDAPCKRKKSLKQ